MSEINAIATNNYLLATQQEVSHDNTLSGNGTVDSPLGVVPGYNETVLWEGTRTSAVTLNELPSNFEYIGICTLGGQISYYNTDNNYKPFTFNVSNDTSCYLNVGRFYLYNSSLTVNKSKAINFGGWTSTSFTTSGITNNWDYGANIISKVIGINRKNNA